MPYEIYSDWLRDQGWEIEEEEFNVLSIAITFPRVDDDYYYTKGIRINHYEEDRDVQGYEDSEKVYEAHIGCGYEDAGLTFSPHISTHRRRQYIKSYIK